MRLVALAALLVLVVGCQSPAPQAIPTSAPTTAPAPPTASPAPPTPAPTSTPTVAPSPVPPATGASRVEILNAANTAFASGDLTTAAALYDRVINTPPTPGEAAAATTAINQFAQFRAMVTLLAAGHEDEARSHLDALQQADPNAPFARLAAQLWDQYSMVGQLQGACAQLQPQIASQAGATLATLQSLGISVDAATLCSVPRS